ncbi:MAG: hypothetical protein NZ455_04455 [Bacteroidia bacterium]|nr:hypothetical protein [Bacteroidia bacterium]
MRGMKQGRSPVRNEVQHRSARVVRNAPTRAQRGARPKINLISTSILTADMLQKNY